MLYIQSSQNKIIKLVNSLKERKNRNKTGLFIAEGERLVRDIPSDWEKEYVLYSKSYSENNAADDGIIVADSIFEKISDTVNPQGIMAVCRKKEYEYKDILKKEKPFIVVLDCLQDPGNLGTVIRTADACGADAVFMSEGCVDLYNSKVIRSAMASVFHIPVISGCGIEQILSEIKEHNIMIAAAHLKGTVYPMDICLNNGCAVIIGNEANGISGRAAEAADVLVKIPMRGKAESMNASVACGIMLYEVMRQSMKG